MKNLYFDYQMQIGYSEPAGSCHYTIKCLPGDTDRQRVEEIHIELRPDSRFCRGEDAWGNGMIFGSVEEPHDSFGYRVTGRIVTGLADSEALGNDRLLGQYRYVNHVGCGRLTAAGAGLQEYGSRLREQYAGECPYMLAFKMMHRLHEDFAYKPQITDVQTTADEAWQLGAGVCQDYAHILIALCRMAGIPSRYVAGMVVGEGASHAWVEILDGQRWYGLDPANDLAVNADYIKLGVGRDAADCALNRGLVMGGGCQTQTVSVTVREQLE